MEKLILWVLMSRCQPVMDQGWTCWPSISTIAMDASVGDASVSRTLPLLEARGLLTREPGGPMSSTTYVLDYVAILALPPNPDHGRKRRQLKRG